MDLRDTGEEEAVSRLRKIHPGGGEDGSVRRADDGEQDGERNKGGPESAEGALGDARGDARSLGDLLERKDLQIGEVRAEVNRHDGGDPESEGEGNVPLRILDLAGDETDAIPALVGPEASDHRDTELAKHERGGRRCGGGRLRPP